MVAQRIRLFNNRILKGGNVRRNICLTGTNILIKVLGEEEKSKSGLIMTFTPSEDIPKERLLSGKVTGVGPGLMIPAQSSNENEIESLINGGESRLTIKYIPLDIQIGYKVYFYERYHTPVFLEGEWYAVIPYQAIVLYDKCIE